MDNIQVIMLLINFYYSCEPGGGIFCVRLNFHNFGHLSFSRKNDSTGQNCKIKKHVVYNIIQVMGLRSIPIALK